MQELKLIDLRRCDSVGDIVQAMSYCSFGARMLGECTTTIQTWIANQDSPIAIYDGSLESPLGSLLQEMCKRGWLADVMTQQRYAEQPKFQDNLIVIGSYSERFEDILATHQKEILFINPYGMALPTQISDGYFPNVIFADPRFIIPAIFFTLDERLNQKRTTITEFVQELAVYGGLATDVSQGAKTLLAMVEDPDCKVMLTLSGAMTIAKMGLIICDMIELDMIHGICSTGALMAHGLVESVGLKHYKYNPNQTDESLAAAQLNRVTDTLEPETNLDHIGDIITQVLDEDDGQTAIGSKDFNRIIGQYLATHFPEERGILKSAYEKNVPVIVPAFYDSELGNDTFLANYSKKQQGQPPVDIKLELDTECFLDILTRSPKTGIFTIGGGVPRNFTQNIPPLIDWMNKHAGTTLPPSKFTYGCRICPDPMYYGHLSGCTYSEGMSWRKMEVTGQFSEIRADATQIWPFLVKFVMEAQSNASSES